MQKILFILGLVFSHLSMAQTGGEHTFQFLDLDFNSRSLALGGDFSMVKDDDINLAVANPALISDKLHKKLSLNHAVFPSGINYGQLAYGFNTNKFGTFIGHLRYVSYGKFDRYDEFGVEQGTFTAGDYALGAGYAKSLNKYFSLGANANVLFSHYESYTSLGVATDLSFMFYDENSNITAALIAKNAGYQLKGFTKKNNEPLPLEILAGISYKFHHAPFRLNMVAHDLTNWDLSYNIPGAQPTIDALTGDTIPVPSETFVKKTFRHLNFGVEIVPNSNFAIRLGYNFNRRASLGVENRMGISGFSAGVGFKIKKFEFDYSISSYSAAGMSNMFSITTNLNEWYRKT